MSSEFQLHRFDKEQDEQATHVHKKDAINIEEEEEEEGRRTFHQFFRQFTWNEVLNELWTLGKMTCPIALTTFLYFSKTIISIFFLGHMDRTELAGGSLAIGFANVSGFSVMKGLCSGMDPICCQAYGARRWLLLSQTYVKTVVLLLISAVPMAFLWLNVESLFHRLGQDCKITIIAKSYLLFSIPDLFIHANVIPLRTFLRTQGLNFPNTIVAACVSLLHLPITYFLAKYLVLSKVAIKPWTDSISGSILHNWKPLLSLALPSVCQVCLEWWWYEIILFLSGLLTNPESLVAAMGILIQTTGAVYIFPFSLSLSISQRVGHELGAAQPARAKLAAMVGVSVGLAYGLFAFVLSIALRSFWGNLYTTQTAACGSLTGSARPKLSVRINIAAFYLVGLPCSAIFAFKLNIGFPGLWFGLVAAQATCLCMTLYTLSRTDWKYEAKRAEELTLSAADRDNSTTTALVA